MRFVFYSAVRIGAVLLNRTAPYDFVFNKTAPDRTVGISKRKNRTEPHRWPRVFKTKYFATVQAECGAVFTDFY